MWKRGEVDEPPSPITGCNNQQQKLQTMSTLEDHPIIQWLNNNQHDHFFTMFGD
jgi:hypothetical protein